MAKERSWTIGELQAALRKYEGDLKAAKKAPNTVQTYVDRAERFIKYLEGGYVPNESPAVERARKLRPAIGRSHP